MHFSAPIRNLASSLFLASAQAAYLNNDLSFGHNDRISPTLRAVPNFHLIGTPNPPEIRSNMIVLTPPAPGNQRGGIWAEKPLTHSSWTVDVDFRATGPERSGGNLQIWYARNGQEDIGTSSIYTVGRFDGLAIVIDQYAGSGGFVRGFLNDGTKEYKSHHAVDSLAFGHCSYPYRNRGRPSTVSVTQSANNFRVTLDGNLCFESPNIKLPLGYNFGVSAASAENPDSFEIFKFVTTTEFHTPDVQDPGQGQAQNFMAARDQNQNKGQSANVGDIPSWQDPPEVPAAQVSQNEQFADLHNRLQAMMKYINSLTRDVTHFHNLAAARHETILELLKKLESSTGAMSNIPASLQKLDNMERKLDDVTRDVKQTKSDLHNALDQHVAGLKSEVRSTHSTLLGTVSGLGLGAGKFLLIVVGSQAVTVGAYLLYKRRKNGGMKKYL